MDSDVGKSSSDGVPVDMAIRESGAFGCVLASIPKNLVVMGRH
jgi:hypothetical protein